MTDIHRIFVRMLRVVISACLANPSMLTLVVKFGERFGITQTKLQAFLTADQVVMALQGGAAKNKETARQKLVGEVELGYDCLESWAIDEGDQKKQDQWHYAPSAINKMTGEELVTTAKILQADINTVTVAELADYGYEAQDLTDLNDTLITFEGLLIAPESDIKLHKAEVEDRDKKYSELVDYVNGPLDKAAKPFKKKNKEFYSLYTICRRLHLQGHRKRTSTDSGADAGEYRKMVPVMSIVKIDFELVANKIYLISNVGDADLKFWVSASADIPTEVPEDAAVLLSGEEIIKTSAELDCPPKVYLFFGNMNNADEGEVAVSEVV